jgi:hypothetical protein
MTPNGKALSAEDLLKTNSLTHQQILERLTLIDNLLITESVKFDEQQIEKLLKLVEKSGYKPMYSNAETNDFDDLISKVDDLILKVDDEYGFANTKSEKYLSNEELTKLYKTLREDKDLDLKIREPRTEIRATKDAKKLKEVVHSKTKITQINKDNFSIEYSDHKDSAGPDNNYIEFLFGIKFKDNKVKFIFEKTFQGADPEKKNSQDRLYPEEIQITMLEKLTKENPEISKKIKSARKINCIRSSIVNDKTAFGISKYLELRIKEPNNLESKKYLSSTPNQSNTENFMNQLIHEFGIGISDSTPPTVLYESKITVALKQTYILEGGL